MKIPEIRSRVTVYRLLGNYDRKYMIGKTYTVSGYQGFQDDVHLQLEGERRTVSLEEVNPRTKLERALT